jgi:hypothetical protein
MPDNLAEDPFFIQLTSSYSESEIAEIKQYLEEWMVGTYINVAHNVLDHAVRKQVDPLRYLRKAHNFSTRRAQRVPPKGYRADDSAVYRKGDEYLIVRLDGFGMEKIVTYGVNDHE